MTNRDEPSYRLQKCVPPGEKFGNRISRSVQWKSDRDRGAEMSDNIGNRDGSEGDIELTDRVPAETLDVQAEHSETLVSRLKHWASTVDQDSKTETSEYLGQVNSRQSGE